MSPAYEYLKWIHVIAGGAMLLLGVILILLPGKGMLRHKQFGRAFAISTSLVVLTAVAIMVFFRFSPFLLSIAILSGYMTFSGYRVFSRKRPNTARPGDWIGAVIAALSGLGLLGYAGLVFAQTDAVVLGILCIVFGLFLLLLTGADIRDFRKDAYKDTMWWWYHHMRNMLGAWLAALTAFLVQNGGWLFPGFEMSWLLWILPGTIGGIGIAVWIGKFRTKFAARDL